MELAGSMGDLGTLLPLAIGMILINGLDPVGVLMGVGLAYILSGYYFRITCPVEPMKVIGAYAVATGVTAAQIQASSLLVFISMLIIGGSGVISLLGRYIPKPVIRGVQLSTGILLISQGVRLMLGTSVIQRLEGLAEPYLAFQKLGPLPVGVMLGGILVILTLFLLDNRNVPAALAAVGTGIIIGLLLGTKEGLDHLRPGIYIPRILPYGLPSGKDLSFALLMMIMPQIPLTLGNAVIATSDLSNHYFNERANKMTYRGLCLSIASINLLSFLVGGMPLCHGSGGLASRYRFGARTGGSNIMIGLTFLALAIFLGPHSLALIYLIPLSVLGVLLLFAGSQLALTVIDMKERKDLFVPLLMVGVTLASNLAVGFVGGIVISFLLKSDKFQI